MAVLIIGGGIAGPVLGVALRKAGIEATVFEAAGQGEGGVGAFLQLAPNGVNALESVGLGHVPATAGGFRTSGIRFTNARGRTIATLDSQGEVSRYGAANSLVKREGLHVALHQAAVSQGVPVEYGKRLTSYRTTSSGIKATFADGTSAHGDVLVGCDGIGSRTRQLLIGPEPRPAYTGVMNLGGFAQLAFAEVGWNHMVFGRHAFFGYTPTTDGQVYWFSNVPEDREFATRNRGLTPEAWLDRLRRLHANDPEPIPQILAAASPPVGSWPISDLGPLPRWHDERVCLVGDAAHAMSPSAGQGASIAIEDAVVLAICLRDLTDPAAAFAAYQRQRKERAESVVKQARRNSNHKVPGPFGSALRDLLLPVFLRLGVKQAADTYSYTIDFNAGESTALTPS